MALFDTLIIGYDSKGLVIPVSATIPRGFTNFKHCIPCSDVDIENDEFILKTELSNTDAVSTPFQKIAFNSLLLTIFKVCLTGLFFDDERIEFYAEKESNEQGFWLDDRTVCSYFTGRGYYFVPEIKIKNGKVSTACDSTDEN